MRFRFCRPFLFVYITKSVPKFEFQWKFPNPVRKFVAELEDEIFKVKRKSFFENKVPLIYFIKFKLTEDLNN